MSFILDALRKSESRRRSNEVVTPAQWPPVERAPSGQPVNRRGLLLMGLLVLVMLSSTAWLTLSEPGQTLIGGLQNRWSVPPPMEADDHVDQPEQLARQSAADTDAQAEPMVTAGAISPPSGPIDPGTQRERVISDPNEIARELDRLAEAGELERREPEDSAASLLTQQPRRRAPTPVDVVAQREAERQEALRLEEQARQRERAPTMASTRPGAPPPGVHIIERDDRGAGTAPPPADTRAPRQVAGADRHTAASAEWRPDAADYIQAWELPLAVRRQLPALNLTIHVFSADESSRFVLINGERFVQGDMVSSGVRLAEIRREGAVLDFREHRFLLAP